MRFVIRRTWDVMSDSTISPCDLIQEHLAVLSEPDWRIFVACMLMNMTRGLTMRPYMWSLFEQWPDAFALAHADIDVLRDVIKPLGFQHRRSMNLVQMSQQYVAESWKTPRDLRGCGKYAYESWLIFCKHQLPDIDDVHDKELRRYIHWKTTGQHVKQPHAV